MKSFFVFYCLILASIYNSGVIANTSSEILFLKKVQAEILVYDSRGLLISLDKLDSQLQVLSRDTNLRHIKQVQQTFRNLIENWKSVETTYLAGSIESDLIDHPAYVDHFHQGNESIPDRLDRVLQSNTELNKALFKHSTRSITALEYLLFPTDQNVVTWQENLSRRIKMAQFMVDAIRPYTQEIAAFYRNDQLFVQRGSQSVAAIFNALVASSYKLKNWRVGEAGGLVAKTSGKSSAQFLEYHYSGYSLAAIRSILNTHLRVFKIANETGFLKANTQSNPDNIDFIQKRIKVTIQNAKAFNGTLRDKLDSSEYQLLFESISKLHDAYYFMLIDTLGIQGQIVDADGD